MKSLHRLIALLVTAALLAPSVALASVNFRDGEGKDQVAVIELGKDIVRTTLPIMETRSGQKVSYQDDDAKKSAK